MTATNLAQLPQSCVPAAFDRGHLYSPTLGQTKYALDETCIYDYRLGDLYEPMPDSLRGAPQDWSWWWSNIAKVETPDFLGLTAGDVISIQWPTAVIPGGTVLATYRFGALVRFQNGAIKDDEMFVSTRNTAGHWY